MLLHGRMSSDEKMEALEAFRSGEAPVLIASTVVEVGVDVPSATIMVIEDANRLGLAQLHQLRGRVGRSDRASTCYLMAPAGDDTATERLRLLETIHSGLRLAEEDLRIRGPGDLLKGVKQSGRVGLSELCIKLLTQEPSLMEAARVEAANTMRQGHLPPVLKAALKAYRFWGVEAANDGISGV